MCRFSDTITFRENRLSVKVIGSFQHLLMSPKDQTKWQPVLWFPIHPSEPCWQWHRIKVRSLNVSVGVTRCEMTPRLLERMFNDGSSTPERFNWTTRCPWNHWINSSAHKSESCLDCWCYYWLWGYRTNETNPFLVLSEDFLLFFQWSPFSLIGSERYSGEQKLLGSVLTRKLTNNYN